MTLVSSIKLNNWRPITHLFPTVTLYLLQWNGRNSLHSVNSPRRGERVACSTEVDNEEQSQWGNRNCTIWSWSLQKLFEEYYRWVEGISLWIIGRWRLCTLFRFYMISINQCTEMSSIRILQSMTSTGLDIYIFGFNMGCKGFFQHVHCWSCHRTAHLEDTKPINGWIQCNWNEPTCSFYGYAVVLSLANP